MSGIIQYLSFYVWFMSLRMSSRFIHVVSVRVSFLLKAEQYIPVCGRTTFCLHSSVDGHSGFHFLAMVNHGALNMGVQIWLNNCFQLFEVHTQKWDCLVIWYHIHIYFLILFIFREKGRKGERGRETSMSERNIDQLPLAGPQLGTWSATHALCPDWELNQ